MQKRALIGTIERAAVDEAARTVPASLSSEMPVKRFGETEVLSHAAGAVDLSRAAAGLPMLFNHDRGVIVGIVENVRLEGLRLVGLLRFGTSDKADEVWRDVQAGVLSHVSISYSQDAIESMADGYVVTRWTPYEASIVTVPADHTVGIGRSAPLIHAQGNTMPQETQDRAATAEVIELCQRHRVPELAAQMIRDGKSVDQARAIVLEELARRDMAAGGHLNLSPMPLNRSGGQTDGATAQREQMIDALATRMGARASGNARDGVRSASNPYQHARISDMARELLEVRGIRTAEMSADRLVERALHTTSDFPELLTGAGNRVLRNSYMAYPGGIKRAFRSSTSRDFRSKRHVMLGEAPALLQVNEHGEFTRGSMAEAKESYALATFGRIFGITRQALVNDDLDAFGSMAAKLGTAAAEFEAKFLVNLLTSNPTMSDTKALFHADHGNLAASGSALSLTSLSAARKALRLMKGLDGMTPVDASPRFLIVPAALETLGEQWINEIQATVATDVNPFASRIELIVEPRLDAVSATAWYLAADSAVIDTIEYAYLEGTGGPEIIAREGFEVDGLEMKARLDFGAGVLDWRGLYKNPGA